MGHVRVNTPPWGRTEFRAALRALLSASNNHNNPSTVLAEALATVVPGRTPILRRSGRDALALAVRGALATRSAGRGREGGSDDGPARVGVPGYVCPAVVQAVQWAGATPIAIDVIDSGTAFDAADLARVVGAGGLDLVVAPSTHGVDPDVGRLESLMPLWVDDAAYTAGRTRTDSSPCGGGGATGVWSFNFKAQTGPGGGIAWLPQSTDEHVADQHHEGPRHLQPGRLERDVTPKEILRWLGLTARATAGSRIPAAFGGATRPSAATSADSVGAPVQRGPMTQLQAAVALVQWRRRHELVGMARANAMAIADAAFDAGLRAVEAFGLDDAVHVVPLLTPLDAGHDAALSARRHLHACGVQTADPYPAADGCSRAHDLARRLVLVPCGPGLRPSDIERIRRALDQCARLLK